MSNHPLDVDTFDWHCLTCHRTRNFGAGIRGLERDIHAGKHLRRFPDHRVALRHIVVERILEPHANQLEIIVDVPPF